MISGRSFEPGRAGSAPISRTACLISALQRAAAVSPNFCALHLRAARTSWRAAGARLGRTEMCFLATLALGGYIGGHFLSDLIDIDIEVIHRFKLDSRAAV